MKTVDTFDPSTDLISFNLFSDGFIIAWAYKTTGDIYNSIEDKIETGKIIMSNATIFTYKKKFPYIQIKARLKTSTPY